MTISPFIRWPSDLVLVLASLSPRRAELLEVAGIPYETITARGAEADAAGRVAELRLEPARYATHLAEAKAAAVAAVKPGRLVLGADTVVVLDGQILEKPRDRHDAVRILTSLSGRRHRVITALALQGGPRAARWSGAEETLVEFLPLGATAIDRYVDTGEPFDKAGAYGIQGYGALMVRRVEGCYFNVMGLPLARLGRALRELFGDDDSIATGDDDDRLEQR